MRRIRSSHILHAVLAAGACTLLIAGLVPGAAGARAPRPAFKTDDPPMLTPSAPGVRVQPIITVGETVDDYLFEALPDGIALARGTRNRVHAYVNHETSTVPFPFTAGDPANSFADFVNAEVGHLILDREGRSGVGVRRAWLEIPSEANYQRFCSSFLATKVHGFDRPLLFTNEEATDFVYREGQAWRGPVDPNNPPEGTEQAGVVVALDPVTGGYRSIYGMGRHNHENSLALAGYGHPVVLSGDDTFSAPSSQLYMYEADDADAVWDDEGVLLAFRSDDASINDYGDLHSGLSVSGSFVEVPREVAVGGQTGLEQWSNDNNVFQFIRVEDLAYDRNDSNVVYFADTGEPRAIPDPATGRLKRGPSGTQGAFPNGRIFKMVLDPSDPRTVESLSVLIDADAGGYDNPGVIHQPDNVETTAGSLLIQEDPGSHNQGATGARIWRYDLDTGLLAPVAEVDQSADPDAELGSWESSGIVDASRFFGPGAFLVDVQAHTLFLTTDLLDVDGDGEPDVTRKREGGQLLLLRIPGA